MKKLLVLCILSGLLCLLIQPLPSQEEKENQKKELQKSPPKKETRSYRPGGRRDPFRNLLSGKEVKEKSSEGGLPQLSIDDIVLIGIVKVKGHFEAIINGPQGFPYFIKKGDKFYDGYVFSINESQVVFRREKESGVLLRKPKDIVKRLYP